MRDHRNPMCGRGLQLLGHTSGFYGKLMPTAVKNNLCFNMGAPLHRDRFVDLFFDDLDILHVFQGSEAFGVEGSFEAALADWIV